MADMVLLRAVRNLTDVREGDQAWVEETAYVAGLVSGGYFEVLDRKAGETSTRKRVNAGGADQAESE